MASIDPATAVANSQRKNSWPSSYGSGRRTSCPWRSSPSGASPGAGTSPRPCFPVDSASSCSDPEAEAVLVRQAHLVAARAPALAEREAEVEARVAVVEAARVRHLAGAVEEPREVDADEGGRHEPERRQRRVAAADRRLAHEDGGELPLLGERRELRAGIRDRDPLLAARREPPEVVGVGARLERRAGLRRADEQRVLEVELLAESADRLRVRGVEHVEGDRPEGAPQHLGRERRASHPEEHDRVAAVRRLGS